MLSHRPLTERVILVVRMAFKVNGRDGYCSGELEDSLDVADVAAGEQLAQLLLAADGCVVPVRLMQAGTGHVHAYYPTLFERKQEHGCHDAFCKLCGG